MSSAFARPAQLLMAAQLLADDLLFPSAAEVDQSGELPRSHLDALADAGLYGLPALADVGPAETAALTHQVVETLASGCLATTFVWLQHLGAVRAAASGPLREEWLGPLCRGERRAAVAQAGVRPGPAAVRATPVPGGFVFDGEAAWVTGWGLVDLIHTAGRDPDDNVIWALIDATAGPTLAVEPLELVAVNASRTVLARFDGLFVPTERVTGTIPYAGWPARDAAGLRTNGSLALGAVGRCLRLLEPLGAFSAGASARAVTHALTAELDARRDQLDAAGPAELPAARAAAAELALRAAGTLQVAAGSTGIRVGEHPQRLLREAAFLLVFGSRPGIRNDLLALVSRTD